jgi:hypothetical protein
MPIPPLDATDFLPEGIHVSTLDEIGARFGQFQTSDRRVRLFSRLQEYMKRLAATAFVEEIIVDGSFVSNKDQPEDIDLVVVLRGDWDMRADLRPFEYNVLARRRVRREFGFDIFSPATDRRNTMNTARFFSKCAGNLNVAKGF